MSIRLLRTLIAVADSRTFSAAADRVHVTHAAVSQQMQTLESDLDITLFDRSKRTPELTPVAHEIVRKARQLIVDYDNLVSSVVDDDGLNSDVTFGALPTTLTGLTPQAMALLRNRFPQLRVHIRPGLTGELLSDIKRGRLDTAVLSKPHLLPLGVEFKELVTEPLELIASTRMAGDDPTSLLATQPFIRFNRNAVVGALIDNWFLSKRIRVSEIMELDSLEAIESMVHANLGVSIVAKRTVQPYNAIPLKRVSLGDDAPSRCLGVAYRQDYTKTRVIEELFTALRDVINESSKSQVQESS
ncbi:MAG: LysR family transcriptional regulator [Granulosicoccus sp.]